MYRGMWIYMYSVVYVCWVSVAIWLKQIILPDAFNNSSDGDSSFCVGSSLWRMTQQSVRNQWDQQWFCYFSEKHGKGTLNKDCCKCRPGYVSGLTKKIGGLPVSSGYYCFHHWREVVSATWPFQELCACEECTQALQVQALPCVDHQHEPQAWQRAAH